MITPALENSRLMRAIRREPVDTTPVWIMRQAGRYLPEYMRVRGPHDFHAFCKRPELAAEVTLDAQRILGVDAAILFADLPTILEPLGFSLSYNPGPAIANPFRSGDDLARVRRFEDVGEMDYVFETVQRVRRGLPADVPLLGFGGAPFTLASYAIEGAGSRNYVHTKGLMYRQPDVWHELLTRLTDAVSRLLVEQLRTGCQAVQIFDSWAGCLSPGDYRTFVLPHTRRLIELVEPHGPVINFLTGNPALLPLQRQAGGAVMGFDWRVELGEAWAAVGHDVAVQGNLDPVVLFAELPEIRRRAVEVLDQAAGRPGHIFNLGHGVLPEMNPEHVKALVEIVHEHGTH
ncbi:MAG: uroporphyrinogen decarboxylase [Planctomycetaceae bacterium]